MKRYSIEQLYKVYEHAKERSTTDRISYQKHHIEVMKFVLQLIRNKNGSN